MDISEYFKTPIWSEQKPEFVKSLNKASDKYIKEARKTQRKYIKQFGDFGMSYHSTPLTRDNDFLDFRNYIGQKSWEFLDHSGFDMSQYTTMFSELWVQEFSKKGGGHHEGHIHYDNHISGFYFLKCSERTAVPFFNDPRIAKTMGDLPVKDLTSVSMATPIIQYKPKPGTMIFFPAYLNHGFTVDAGVDDFRFIHFNLQAVRKLITNHLRNSDGKNKR